MQVHIRDVSTRLPSGAHLPASLLGAFPGRDRRGHQARAPLGSPGTYARCWAIVQFSLRPTVGNCRGVMVLGVVSTIACSVVCFWYKWRTKSWQTIVKWNSTSTQRALGPRSGDASVCVYPKQKNPLCLHIFQEQYIDPAMDRPEI